MLLRSKETNDLKRSFRWLACLSGAMLVANGTCAQLPQPRSIGVPIAKPALPNYRVVELIKGCPYYGAPINKKDQVAFTLDEGAGGSAFFYDGATVASIGTRGGTTYTRGLNDAGQVTGWSGYYAFLWSSSTGMTNLGTLPHGSDSQGIAVNNLGQVFGIAEYNAPMQVAQHAMKWTASGGMQDLGSLTGLTSYPVAINDAGMAAGYSSSPDGSLHAVAWIPGSGIMDLGTLGGRLSWAAAVGADGQVAGYSETADGREHAFLWTEAGGMEDLGAGGGTNSHAVAINANGTIAGTLDKNGRHAMTWTRTGGMRDLGTLGGKDSIPTGINKSGQVVGYSDTTSGARHAFVWSPAYGMLDLNARLQGGPAGLVLDQAVSISDSGAIVAISHCVGLYLLKPGFDTGGPATAPSM